MSSLDALPLDEMWPDIAQVLKAHQNLVLVAEPGAGKTTRFPPRLLASNFIPKDKKVLMLEPRRLAARASAYRIAEEQGWSVGEEVGYQVRFENRITQTTRLQVVTEGLLAKRLQSDSELKDIGAVILDEFHERSIHTDLAIGLLFELQQLTRPDLRIIVMSATLDAEKVSGHLDNCPIVNVPGRTYPVDIFHSKKPLRLETDPSFIETVSHAAIDAIHGRIARTGDILVFLPGAREIRQVRERIESSAQTQNFSVFELHGSLSLEEQNQALTHLKDRNKIVLATNIAETSLTIDGVGTVIDSGLARIHRLDKLGLPRLQLSRISIASATQRAGRAGRQSHGYCHRLWNKMDEASMLAFEVPEIHRTELTEAIMTLAGQGITDPESFSWFEKPPSEMIRSATELLHDLGLREKSGHLTELGCKALQLPLSARLARLVLTSIERGLVGLGVKVAALLSEKDIVRDVRELKRLSTSESDLLLRLHLLNDEGLSHLKDRAAARSILRVADALFKSAKQISSAPLKEKSSLAYDLSEQELGHLLLSAFPDRVCRRRRPGERAARMVSGRGVSLAPFSSVETSALFLALDTANSSGATGVLASADIPITVASAIKREWLEEIHPQAISRQSRIVFDEESRSIQKQTALFFRDLPIEDPHVARPSPEEAFDTLRDACLNNWDAWFAQNEKLRSLMERIHFLKAHFPEEFNEIDLEGMRGPFLDEICYNEFNLSRILDKSLAEIFVRHLPSGLSRLLHEAAPESIRVPSGNRIRLHYPADRPPYLEVRIQEIFGMMETPRIGNGRVAIALHLLGPNYRPVQVTSDLKSFWLSSSGYAEVRKELRARYPKHSWPEDPLTAIPVARGRSSK